MDDVVEVIKSKPQADKSLGERSVLQAEAVIELVEVCVKTSYWRYIISTEWGDGRGNFFIIGRQQHFCVEIFEQMSWMVKVFWWYLYYWKHVMDNLHLFMGHINNLRMTINFTKKLECNGSVPFCLSWSLDGDQFWNNSL